MAFESYKHAFRSVDSNRHESFITHLFNGSTSTFRCEICDEGITGRQIEFHCSDKKHILKLDQLRALQRSPLVRTCAELRHRGLKAWQTDVESKLFWILLHDAYDCGNTKFEMTSSTQALVESYELRELLPLLELAVWKAVCVLHPERSDLTAKSKGHLAWQDWARYDWKEHKATMRNANEIDIVIACVIPFLRADNAAITDASENLLGDLFDEDVSDY
jgi:hypothetical protein